MSTSPHELGLPVRPNCQPGNCTGLGRTIHLNSHNFSITEVASSITPMMCVQREPILRCINFQLSHTHNQVLWGYSILERYRIQTNISFIKNHHLLQVIFTFKFIQWNDSSFQGFKFFSSHKSHVTFLKNDLMTEQYGLSNRP